jgi:acetyl esterase/lipase
MVLLLHFCSPVSVLNSLPLPASVSVKQDVAYSDGARHRLDIYSPHSSAGAAPVVIFFYGGGWQSGDRAMYRFVGVDLAKRGMLVVIPDYRLHPDVQFPAFMQDAAAALAWVHKNAARYGGDPHRLFLLGHSAGAQIATLLALDPEYLSANHLAPDRDICGVIGLAGLYDFLPAADASVEAVFGPEANWPHAQPMNYVTPHAPAMLLLTGESDHTVDPGNTLRLAARLRDAGGKVQVELEPGISHRAIIMAFSDLLAFLTPVRQRTLDFIAANACAQP